LPCCSDTAHRRGGDARHREEIPPRVPQARGQPPRTCVHAHRELTPPRVRVYTVPASPRRAHTRTRTHGRACTCGFHVHDCPHRSRTHVRAHTGRTPRARPHRDRTLVGVRTEYTRPRGRGVRGPSRLGRWSGAPQTRRKGCHLSLHGTPHREAGPKVMFPTCPPRGPAHRGALAHRGAMPTKMFPTCPPRGPAHRGALAHRGAMPTET
jgi:hypothetical protein